MTLKSDGKQFLLNIKPKYRKSVTPILQMLKENREASDFVCQAILEKVARDVITSIESQVEVLLEGNVDMLAPRRASVSRPFGTSTAQKEVSATKEVIQEQSYEAVQHTSTPLSLSNREQVEESTLKENEVKEPPVKVEEEIVLRTKEKEMEPIQTDSNKEQEAESKTEQKPSLANPTVKNPSQTNEVRINLNGKDVKPKEKGIGSALFDMD